MCVRLLGICWAPSAFRLAVGEVWAQAACEHRSQCHQALATALSCAQSALGTHTHSLLASPAHLYSGTAGSVTTGAGKGVVVGGAKQGKQRVCSAPSAPVGRVMVRGPSRSPALRRQGRAGVR